METKLRRILGPTPTNAWAALIPQLLLWCFKRFVVATLSSSEEVPMIEQRWGSFLELVENYAPEGLRAQATSWMEPDHVEKIPTSLLEYDRFFMDILQRMDILTVSGEEDDMQAMSRFLDERIPAVVRDWIGDGPIRAFHIYPETPTEEDKFPDVKLVALIGHFIRDTPLPTSPATAPDAPNPDAMPYIPTPPGTPIPEEEAEPVKPTVAPVALPAPPPPPEPTPLVARWRTRTHRVRGRRALTPMHTRHRPTKTKRVGHKAN